MKVITTQGFYTYFLILYEGERWIDSPIASSKNLTTDFANYVDLLNHVSTIKEFQLDKVL